MCTTGLRCDMLSKDSLKLQKAFQKASAQELIKKVSQFGKRHLTQEHLIFKLILLDQHISCPSEVIEKLYTTKRKSYLL